MLQTASFFSDAEINAVFAQTPAENSNIEHIGNIIQQIQLHMDTVLDILSKNTMALPARNGCTCSKNAAICVAPSAASTICCNKPKPAKPHTIRN